MSYNYFESHFERPMTGDDSVEMSIVKRKASEYIGLLAKLSSDLPFCERRSGQNKVDQPLIDSFIGRYAPNHLGENMQIQLVATILDAELIRRNSTGVRFDRATEVLDSFLRTAYSARGETVDSSLDKLYERFFTADRMSEINQAIGIRSKWFDSHNHFSDPTQVNADYYCGVLSGTGI